MEHKAWYRDGYFVSTDPRLVHVDAVNFAFGSGQMWWCAPLPKEALEAMIRNSLCFGLYILPTVNGEPSPPMVGFARVVTDCVSFAYLSDVYVLEEHQGRGLARWMLECLNEVLDSWPYLRRLMLVATSQRGAKLYGSTLGARERSASPSSSKLILMEKMGPGMIRRPD